MVARGAEVIRRAETVEEVFARDVVPERLGGPAAGSRASDARASRADDARESRAGDARQSRAGDARAEPAVLVLDHASVSCRDLERSLSFYRDLLGLPLRERGEECDGEIAAVSGQAGLLVRWADLQLPDGRVLELLAPQSGPVDKTPGRGHVALRVADADAVHARLVAAGVAVHSTPVAMTGSAHWRGARCFYAQDPDGQTVEVIEWAP